jgi:hypothetical protein
MINHPKGTGKCDNALMMFTCENGESAPVVLQFKFASGANVMKGKKELVHLANNSLQNPCQLARSLKHTSL